MLKQGNLVRFQCRTGHTYSPESMLEAQNDNVERLMWSAARALEEQAEYVSQMADQIAKADNPLDTRQFVAKSRSALQKAQELRKLLTTDP
jgi:two-component system, chemotaxis family, protein-glutamate methylesterase/glutaminase